MNIKFVKIRGQTAIIETRIAFSNYVFALLAGALQHFLLEEIFNLTNWAFLGNGSAELTLLSIILCLFLFGEKKFRSIFLLMSGLEHYAFVVKRVFVLISILVFLILFLSLPGGRNFILISLLWQVSFWLLARKLLSIWVKMQVRELSLLIISDKFFVSDFFNKNFDKLQVSKEIPSNLSILKGIDIILFYNFSDFDLEHFVLIAHLQRQGITSGYISNEIRLQGWSGVQLLVGPHLMMINSNYNSIFAIKAWKRGFDLLLTFPVFCLLLPFLAILSLFLFVQNGNQILFKQERVGANGKAFKILKFRTLKNSSSKLPAMTGKFSNWVDKPQENELLALGRWLRRWSIDELPQLVNVLSGQMSLVGPRPRLGSEVDEFYVIASPLFTSGLKPGITGLWQISGRHEIDSKFALILDKYYVDNWNPLMDLQILAKTLRAIRSGIGAK